MELPVRSTKRRSAPWLTWSTTPKRSRWCRRGPSRCWPLCQVGFAGDPRHRRNGEDHLKCLDGFERTALTPVAFGSLAGFLFRRITALDLSAAVSRTTEILDQLSARMAVGTQSPLALLDRVWVKGDSKPRRVDRVRRGVWVEALERENQLYDATSSGGIHAAIELLAHLQISSSGAAVAGGWAAIEALLSEPSDRGGAAERLAMLVACSFPRAELTNLSYALATLSDELRSANTNQARCDIAASAITEGRIDSSTLPPSDRAALARMSELLPDPAADLDTVCKYASMAFRRLYRQRNLVLHWGRTNGVALQASLRTAAPLVGAGIDRIIHAHYVDDLSPLQLVARAKVSLATVGTKSGPACTRLLNVCKT